MYTSNLTSCSHCGYVEGDIAKELYHLYPGTVLNERYIVGQVLGFGGFGVTYLAWDTTLNTTLAIKEYYPSGLVNRVPGTKGVSVFTGNRLKEYNHGLMRFLDEARSMAKFSSHKDIINIFEYFEENGTAYIVMEYLDGLTLSEYLKSNSMDVDDSIQVISHICAALKDVHSAGIVHRDVSPDNIFLCATGVIKLIDFGAARFSNNEEQQLTIILKPGFAPPEQYERVNVQGPWTDIYALGATMYYMVTGMKPEESTNRKIADNLPAPHEVDPSIPAYIGNTIMQAMAIDRHIRFASVTDFEKALNQKKKALPVTTIVRRRKARRFVGLAAAFLLIFVSAAALYMIWNRQDDRLPPASISMAFMATGYDDIDSARMDAFTSIIDAFLYNVEDVSIEMRPLPKEGYEAALLAAIARGDAPTLFESTGLGAGVLGSTIDLTGVLDLLEMDEFHFLNEHAAHFPGRNQLPLGFSAPAIFINTTLSDFAGPSIRNIYELATEDNDAPLVVNPSDIGVFINMFGDSEMEFRYDAKELFFESGAEALFANTSIFFDIQDALPARYRLVSLDVNAPAARFADLWSISQGISDNERIVAERFLSYLLSDNAQDIMHIRNRSGSLPINRYVLAIYSEVYNDFAGFFTNINRYVFTDFDLDTAVLDMLLVEPVEEAEPAFVAPVVSINRNYAIPGVVGEPFTFHRIAGRNVGVISVRAMIYMIGSDPVNDVVRHDPVPGWNTVRGYNTRGQEVTLALSDGEARIIVTVDGEQHPMTDLAEWAGPETGVPARQLPVYNIGGNLFLPIRAVANIFGYSMELIGGDELVFTPLVWDEE